MTRELQRLLKRIQKAPAGDRRYRLTLAFYPLDHPR